mmetsp:Transcript_3990/g.8669  ORF Transcript_3990/g.8669 Transcript_3990/m.8669 type:complete len:208 (-) Transcript_3990:496-1119(-)
MLHVGCATNAAQSDEQGRTPLNTRSRRTHRTVSNGAGRACGDWHVTSRGLLVDVSSNLHTWCPPVKRLKASGPADTCLAVARSTSCDEGEAEADLASIVHLLLGCIQAGKLVALFPPLLSGGSYLGCCRSAAAVRALQFGFSRRGRLNCVRGQRFHPMYIHMHHKKRVQHPPNPAFHFGKKGGQHRTVGIYMCNPADAQGMRSREAT